VTEIFLDGTTALLHFPDIIVTGTDISILLFCTQPDKLILMLAKF
jgi:hypothetical protein